MSENESQRTTEEIIKKIDQLREFSDYGRGPKADYLRYKHQGWIDALRWVLGNEIPEEP